MSTLEDELARLAADRGHGDYSPTTPYGPDDVAVVVDDVIDQPDRIVVVRAYPYADEPDSSNPWTEGRWQFRFRGPASGDRTDSALRAQAFLDDVHGLGPLELPSGLLVMSVFALQPTALPIGRDPAGRHEHTVNVRAEFLRPTAHRPA